MDLFLSLRDPRCLQPLRHRLDGRLSRKRGVGPATDRGKLQKTIHPARSTHAPCGSWHLDEVQTGSSFTRRSGCHENAQSAARLGRQSLFREPIPNPKISAGVPGPLWVYPGQSCFLSEFFSVVQRRAPSLWRRLVDASDGSLWPSGKRTTATPGCTRCCLPTSPGALRTKRSQTTGSSQRSLD